MRLNALRQRRIEAAKSHEALLDSHLKNCETESRGFTAEEKTAQAQAEAAVATLDEQIEAEEKRLGSEKARAAGTPSQIPALVSVSEPNLAQDPRKGFAGGHREFFLAAMRESGYRDRSQIRDERLKLLAQAGGDDGPDDLAYMLPIAFTPPSLRDLGATPQAAAGSDEQGVYDFQYGGAAVRTSFRPGLLQLGFEGDPTAGRTQMVPMASPSVEMIARVDKDHSSSVSGGFTVTRKPETVALTSSRGSIEKVTLKATGLFGLAYATEEILTDSAISFMAVIETGLRDQFAHEIFAEKLRGGGGNEFLGILTALASSSLGPTIAVTRDTSNSITAEDALNMQERCWNYGRAIWLANHDTRAVLSKMHIAVGTGGQLVYHPSFREDQPDTLLGRPIFYSEYPSSLGSAGDLILGVWSEFLEGVYQPLRSAESIHVRFVNHERTFKFWIRNAGAPWWRTALTPNQSSDTLSPFVIIAA